MTDDLSDLEIAVLCDLLAVSYTHLDVYKRQSLLQPTAIPLGSLTPAETPLIDAGNLFRQPGPPHSADAPSGPVGDFKRPMLKADSLSLQSQ